MYKSKKSKFLILVPAFNELKNLKKFVKKIKKIAPLCILDDCSTDNTENWLLKNNIKFIKNKKNLGYEKNLINGIKSFKKKSDYLITFDGDGQHRISDLRKIVNLDKTYDVIVCNRKVENRFLEIIISYISQYFFGIKDPLSGFKVYKTNILKKNFFENIGDYFLLDFLIKLSQRKFKIINIEIVTHKRLGKPKVGNLINLTIKELKILSKLIFMSL